MLKYSSIDQINDILPSFAIALIVGSVVFSLNFVGIDSPLPLLVIQLFTGALLTILICELTKFKDYYYIKNNFFVNYKSTFNR